MKATMDRTGTTEGLAQILREASEHPDTGGVLLFTCDGNGYQPSSIDPLLRQMKIPLAGGVFPAVFQGEELLERGSIALSLPKAVSVLNLNGPLQDDSTVRDSFVASGLHSYPTMLVLVDGLAFNATRLLDALFDVFGLDIKYFGGGAGSLTLDRRPCLLMNDGFTQGGALVVGLDLNCGIGVAHGLTRVGGPHQITAASGNTVHSIDWRPAASYFRELVRKQLGPGETDTGGVVSRNFCLAIDRLDGEYVVREAVKLGPGDSLEFATQMRENELVDLVRADEDAMLRAAIKAREDARKALSAQPATNLCFDCCARQMYLGEIFSQELRSLSAGGVPLFGAITVGGEIANNGDCYLDYYNRTCVVGAFEV